MNDHAVKSFYLFSLYEFLLEFGVFSENWEYWVNYIEFYFNQASIVFKNSSFAPTRQVFWIKFHMGSLEIIGWKQFNIVLFFLGQELESVYLVNFDVISQFIKILRFIDNLNVSHIVKNCNIWFDTFQKHAWVRTSKLFELAHHLFRNELNCLIVILTNFHNCRDDRVSELKIVPVKLMNQAINDSFCSYFWVR